MDRRLLAGTLVLLIVTSGCLGGDRPLVPGGLTGTPTPDSTPVSTTDASRPETTAASPTTAGEGTSGTASRPADPATDRIGWEGGYWANETLPFGTADGLNETELEALVARTMARVELIRRIEFEEPVPVETISRAAFSDRYASGGGASERVRTYRNARFEALFLVGESTDAVDERQDNRGSGVLGFYSAGTDQITIVTDTETVRIQGSVLAHELVHAYQFRQTDAGRLGARTTDGFSAIRSVIEGDASFVEQRYERRCTTEWTCLTKEPGGNLSGIHFGLYYLTLFPYTDGETFVEAIHRRAGWSGVDRLYERPPGSAEEVIYPDRYPNSTVRSVRLPDRSDRDWRPVYSGADRLGQPAVAAMFAYTTVDGREGAVIDAEPFETEQPGGYDYNFSYADGWAGDAFRVYRNGSGAVGYVWRIAWDSPADAEEFASGYRELLRYWGGAPVADREGVWRIPADASPFADAFYIEVSDDTVTIVNAPSVGRLPDVHDGAAP